MPPDPELLPKTVKRLITDPTNNSGGNDGDDAATGGGAQPDAETFARNGPLARRLALKKIRRKKKRTRFRGVPPPLAFDLESLPDSTLLTIPEVAAAMRRSIAAVSNMSQQPDHPLRWRLVANRRLCEVPSLRAVLRGDEEGRR